MTTRSVLFPVLLLFAFHTAGQTPGALPPGKLVLWFKSDKGVVTDSNRFVSEWHDVSGQGNVTVVPVKAITAHVVLVDDSANYNPSVLFLGGHYEMLRGAANNLGGTPTILTVTRLSDSQPFSPIFSNAKQVPVTRKKTVKRNTYEYIRVGPGLFNEFDTYVADGIGSWSKNAATAAATANEWSIVSVSYGSPTSTGETAIYHDGGLVKKHTSNATVPVDRDVDVFEIGGRTLLDETVSPRRIFSGHIAELIYCNEQLNTTDRLRAESYLAIKYGITLNANYLASDGSVIYDVKDFNRRVIAIGRDDASGLHQKQSRDESDESILQIAIGEFAQTNMKNKNSFSTDKCFVIVGDNGQDSYSSADKLPDGSSRLERKWQCTVTGESAKNIVFQMPLLTLSTIPGNGNVYVLFADNQDLTSNPKRYLMKPENGQYRATIPQLTPGTRYFTFVRDEK
jgi:hypothetical protein